MPDVEIPFCPRLAVTSGFESYPETSSVIAKMCVI